MTYLVALVVYEWFYLILYLGAPALLYLLFEDSIPHGVRSSALLQTLFGCIMVGLFFVGGYRAKLAAGEFARGDTGVWRAHLIAGSILRAQLSYVPVLGRFFTKDEAESAVQISARDRNAGPPPPIE